MNSSEIRQKFLDFFAREGHEVVPSAPMVVKNDPTLMFTNAGMNQFKDIFLGNSPVKYPRIADTQKCLRVSGKHNDLEEVGHDTYHHTMFEMLGNWSFGDYFKREAIAWAWEFLTEVLNIDKDRLYVTIFEGDDSESLERDDESYLHWKSWIDETRILPGNKKDNFWEMGDTGPCGPCSEIHVDIRNETERKKVDGRSLVNKGHPQVIEIWNLVFIQFNRKADGKLVLLPKKHVDTGMGFERLCMVVQGKTSNYDTDVFQPVIREISDLSGIKYGSSKDTDIAMRVVADHLRAVAFAIADGQLPSNVKAGYVIRRILRRAVRYNFTFLKHSRPVICKLVPVLVSTMGDAFPELKAQQQLIEKVIKEEEQSFLRTLETGIRLLDQIIEKTNASGEKEITGSVAFELYDTYGFPLDLTELILKEHNLSVNQDGFREEMKKQKERSKNAAIVDAEDWVEVVRDEVTGSGNFVGYDKLDADIRILKYRKVITKGREIYQLVFDTTPFYAESGGQVGDKGYITDGKVNYKITGTIKENNLTIHLSDKLPENPGSVFKAVVSRNLRSDTASNHTATHLLHYALRKVLGTHVEQKGSLVHPDYLRFDFSHFQKLTDEEIEEVESIVNRKIRDNISSNIDHMPFDDARKLGAMALFGEKYGDTVRVVQFDDSIELCGGTHVHSTGEIGFFKIISESAVAAGVRRIEAITGTKFEAYFKQQEKLIGNIKSLLKNPQDLEKAVQSLVEENASLQKQVEQLNKEKTGRLKNLLLNKVQKNGNMNIIAEKVDIESAGLMRDLAYQLKDQVENLYLVLGANLDDKANLAIMISEELVKEKNLHAGQIIREAAKEIQGGGGGQPFFATAGGKDIAGIEKAIKKAVELAASKI
ncbi:MAG: alanine--tRNA ligase [Bacteroidales bacterium]|nr:alanine--tRNA ligase [Bacteroidales bacterium]